MGEDRTAEYLRVFDMALALLCDHPKLGVTYAERLDVRSYPVGQPRLYYVAGAKTLSVLRVLHKAMDAERHL